MITPSISTPIDVNTSIYFTAPTGYFSYTWSGAVTGTGPQSNTVSFTTPGTYTVSVLICDENNCCGRYSYTFDVVNECPGVTISTSSNSCTNITVTVTGGTGTKTYKVDGPYGTTTPVTALPGGGVFTINTSSFPAGATGAITITVYIDDGSEICSKTTTVNYTRCSCLCDDSNNCQSLLILASGGNAGYTKNIGIFQAGKVFNWYFDPIVVADRLEIEYNGVTILNTGDMTGYSMCGCYNDHSNFLDCSCASYFLGDISLPWPSEKQIILPVGFASITGHIATCPTDSTKPSYTQPKQAPNPPYTPGSMTYRVRGSLILDPLIALEGSVEIKIFGRVCSSGDTNWNFSIDCA